MQKFVKDDWMEFVIFPDEFYVLFCRIGNVNPSDRFMLNNPHIFIITQAYF